MKLSLMRAGIRKGAHCNDIGYTEDVSTSARDMNLPALDLHELRGAKRGTWAVKVSGNWRVTFIFLGMDVHRVDYEDYH